MLKQFLKLFATLERGFETRSKLFALFEHGVETKLKLLAMLEVALDALRPASLGAASPPR